MSEEKTSKVSKATNYMTEPKITRAQFLISLIGLLVFVLMETSILQDAEIIKTIIYATLIIISVATGASAIQWKNLKSEMKKIWGDQKIELWDKVKQSVSVIMPYLDMIGETFEQLNDIQFKKKEE